MPTVDQPFAVIIGRAGTVAQPVGCVAIHAGLATDNPLTSVLGGGEKGLDTDGVDGGKAGHCGCTVRCGQIKVALGDRCGIIGIIKSHLFGKGIGVEPVNQPFAPTGNDRGLRIMHMAIDKAGADQFGAVIPHLRLRMLCRQRGRRPHGIDFPISDQNSAVVQDRGGLCRVCLKRRIGKRQNLPFENGHTRHLQCSFCPSAAGLSHFRGFVPSGKCYHAPDYAKLFIQNLRQH